MTPMNAFAILGLEERLTYSEDDIRAAFRNAGKNVHPDAGGGEGEFAELKEAQGILASPARRLRHWMERNGTMVETRGTIGGNLMELFGEIGAVTQRVEALARKRETAKTALARALLEGETQVCREELETMIGKTDQAIAEECEEFPLWETGYPPESLDRMQQSVRNLTFLEKWRAGLRAGYSRLV